MMKRGLLFAFLLYSSFLFSQEYTYIEWKNILLDRTVEDLHKVFSQERDEKNREILQKHLLVTESGGVYNYPYFDTYTYQFIKPHMPLKRGILDKKLLKKLLKQTKRTHLYFFKVHIASVNGNIYIVFDQCFATRSKNSEKGVFIKKNKTYAVYVYQFDNDKKDYILKNKKIFGIKNDE